MARPLSSAVPTAIVTMPPPATRSLASPAPVPARRPRWTAGHAAVATHVAPSAVIALAHESRCSGDQAFIGRGNGWSDGPCHDRRCRDDRECERRGDSANLVHCEKSFQFEYRKGTPRHRGGSESKLLSRIRCFCCAARTLSVGTIAVGLSTPAARLGRSRSIIGGERPGSWRLNGCVSLMPGKARGIPWMAATCAISDVARLKAKCIGQLGVSFAIEVDHGVGQITWVAMDEQARARRTLAFTATGIVTKLAARGCKTDREIEAIAKPDADCPVSAAVLAGTLIFR
jgi:hypothetical protein